MKLSQKVKIREINRLLWNEGKTVSTAESCSCGRLATLLGYFSGSSSFFKGGIVCYCDEMKSTHLGVSAQLLAEKTAVCQEVAEQMVLGANQMFGTDYAISMTGVAGPTGATPENPIGSIWVAWGNSTNLESFHFLLNSSRDGNVDAAIEGLLDKFTNYLKKELEES